MNREHKIGKRKRKLFSKQKQSSALLLFVVAANSEWGLCSDHPEGRGCGLIVIALYYILFRPGILIQTKMFEHETVSGFGKMRGSVKILRGLYFTRHGSCEHWTLNALSCIHQSSPKRNCEKITPAPGMQAISQPGVFRFNCHLKLGKNSI